MDMSATVLRLEYDPNRSANIALVEYEDGERRYILAPVGLAAGDKVISSTWWPCSSGARCAPRRRAYGSGRQSPPWPSAGRGGGNKRKYRIIDFKRDKTDMTATVLRLEECFNHGSLPPYTIPSKNSMVLESSVSWTMAFFQSLVRPGRAAPIRMDEIKTKAFKGFLDAVKCDGKAVVITPEVDQTVGPF